MNTTKLTRKHSSCQPYVLWWPTDVSTGGGGPHMNNFEQVSSDGYQMSVPGTGHGREELPYLMSQGAGPGGPISDAGTGG